MASVTHLLVAAFVVITIAFAKKDRGSFSFRYLPRPLCPENAVCAEVNTLSRKPWDENDVSLPLFTSFICKCPEDQECPTHPGTHTLHVGKGRWYSMCKPICSFEKCERRAIAEEVLYKAKDFGGRTYTKVNCLCPGHENSDMTDEEAATMFRESKTDDPRADVVYQRTCTSYHPTWKRADDELEIEELEKRRSLRSELFKKWN
ncbi:uncharacterized protein LOC135479529 [Liolophura sinensis]|uniref:uncharacterized protein LOC135479529 n=1 Tax=Liolophura sinensis TaxID=3198878 RepID=UPI003158FAAF